MSIIDYMSEPERQSWVTLIADGLVFVWFWKVMAPGWSLMPDNFSPSELGGLYFKLIIITIFYHAGISIVFALKGRKDAVGHDERDLEIQSAGARTGYGALQLGLGVVIVTALLGYVIGDTYKAPISLDTPVQFLFALTMVSYAADLLRHAVIVLRYRAI